MKAQAASLPFTNIYAAIVAIVNTKLPQVGDLLVRRLIMAFRKGFRRNDKAVAVSSTMFLAHLVNTQVVHEILVAEILLLLLNKPTDDSVEIAVGIMKEVGQFLEDMNSGIANAIFEQFRNILHEADLDKRTQYMIEVLFQVRKEKYKENPAVKEELDLVEEEDQHTHRHGLDDEIKTEDMLNVFKVDPNYEENEAQYQKIKAEILGEEEGSDEYGDVVLQVGVAGCCIGGGCWQGKVQGPGDGDANEEDVEGRGEDDIPKRSQMRGCRLESVLGNEEVVEGAAGYVAPHGHSPRWRLPTQSKALTTWRILEGAPA